MQRGLRITLAVTAATGAILAGAGTAFADDEGTLGGVTSLLNGGSGSTSESSDQGTSEEGLKNSDELTKKKDDLGDDSSSGNEKKSTSGKQSSEGSKSKDSKDSDKSKGSSGSHGSTSSSSGGSSSGGE